MNALPIFRRLLTMSVTVRQATLTRTQFNNVELDDWAETSDSPINGLVQSRSSGMRMDEFFGRWPMASHVLFCATGVTITVGDVVSWADAEGTTRYGGVTGPPEDPGGQLDHYEIALVEAFLIPSGVT